MSDGFLNDLGLDKVEADPNYIGAGQWPAFLVASRIVDKKSNDTQSWVLTYKIAPDSPQYAGREQAEWFNITNPSEQNKAWMKKRVLSLGVPESKVSTMNPDFVVGLAVYITVRHKNGYQNVVDVVLRDEKTGEVISPGVSGFVTVGESLDEPPWTNAPAAKADVAAQM